jgi:stearoyl-CoA desaturase (delta-9 desaturase)
MDDLSSGADSAKAKLKELGESRDEAWEKLTDGIDNAWSALSTCVRVVGGLHATWLVNSATHMWGSKRFRTKDDSRNNWWVAMLTFGEGWHNNHHAHPASARHGLAWYELDITWLQILLLAKLGIATNLKVAKVDSQLVAHEAA